MMRAFTRTATPGQGPTLRLPPAALGAGGYGMAFGRF
jgi:hypothetical protein